MNTQVKKLLRGKKACSPSSHLWLKKKNGSMTKGAVKIGQGQYGRVYRGCVDDGCKKYIVYKEIRTPSLSEKTNNVPLAGFKKALLEINPKMEFTIAQKLENFGVPKMYLYKSCDKKDILYSELIDGEELGTWFINKPSLEAVKSVMAQVIHNLYRIKQRFPGFRHHDLHSGNVLIRSVPRKDIQIKVQNTKFSIPNGGVEAVMIDFGFSVFPRIKNPLVNESNYKNIGISRKSNEFYDLHFFLNTMYGLARRPANRTERLVKNYVESLFSKEYLGVKSTKIKMHRLRGNVNHALPGFEAALTKPFFMGQNRETQVQKLIKNVIKRPMVTPRLVAPKPRVNQVGNAKARAIAILKAAKQAPKKRPAMKTNKK